MVNYCLRHKNQTPYGNLDSQASDPSLDNERHLGITELRSTQDGPTAISGYQPQSH
jgi:hypothetical protein